MQTSRNRNSSPKTNDFLVQFTINFWAQIGISSLNNFILAIFIAYH